MSTDEKGSDNSLTLVPSILLGRVNMGGFDHEFRQRAAEAIMHALRKVEAMRQR